jgi:hypothetical protein
MGWAIARPAGPVGTATVPAVSAAVAAAVAASVVEEKEVVTVVQACWVVEEP